jgi:hypothetical protein
VNQGPTGLREADVNLNVALFLRDYLNSVGIDTVVMTRVDDSINPTLSQREAIANTAGVDWFHSVHHNATGLPTNVSARYTLMLFQEQLSDTQFCPNGHRRGTGQPAWPGQSDVMSDHMGRRIWQALRTTDYRLRLDWSFYGGCNGGFNLGVLNDLQMPGQLSEGTFHDHAGEEAKLYNIDFNRMEARGLFTGILDYFNTDSLKTGALIGYLQDQDTGKFLNGVEVLLLPDSLRYTTDSFNNGIYVFDDLPPGTYTVRASKPGYQTVERQVTVAAHAFNYGDVQLVDIAPPQVTTLTTTPSDTATDPYQKILVSFSRPMDQTSTLQAFSLDPPVAGLFRWDRSSLTLSFEPKKRFEFDTEYRLQIDASALDIHGHPLDGDGDGNGGDAYTAIFHTAVLDTTFPLVYDFYPARLDSGIFVRDVLRVVFSKPMDPATLVQKNIFLKTGFDRPVELAIDYFDVPPFGQLTFVPRAPLKPGSKYFLTLVRNIADRSGNQMPKHFQWTFVTDPTQKNLFYYDDFEADSLRWRIDFELSRGLVADSSALSVSQGPSVSDSSALRVRYAFSDASGAMTMLIAGVSDSLSGMLIEGQEVAVYVYGDGSGLRLRPVFADADGLEFGPWRQVSWKGWGLERFVVVSDSLEAAPGGNGIFDAAALYLAGLQLAPGDTLTGAVWIDDVLKISDALPTVVEGLQEKADVPREITLLQNYPNPFSISGAGGVTGETTIRYHLKNPADVRVEVFNLRGQRVRTLVQSRLPAGGHTTRWDGRDDGGRPVSGGVYLIRLRAGDQVVTRRAVLLK